MHLGPRTNRVRSKSHGCVHVPHHRYDHVHRVGASEAWRAGGNVLEKLRLLYPNLGSRRVPRYEPRSCRGGCRGSRGIGCRRGNEDAAHLAYHDPHENEHHHENEDEAPLAYHGPHENERRHANAYEVTDDVQQSEPMLLVDAASYGVLAAERPGWGIP